MAISLSYKPILFPWSSYLDAQINKLFNTLWKSDSSRYHQTQEEMETEYEVIVKCQKNPRYFAPIYERYYDSIFIFVNRRLDNEEATADVTSIVFHKCLENIKKFKFQGVPFSAWLFRIAISEVNQFFRRQKKHNRAVSITDYHISILFDEMESSPQRDKHQVITTLLERISPEEIQFLELRFFEGHSFREVGYLLGLTEVNAKIKTYRILKKLKKIADELGME